MPNPYIQLLGILTQRFSEDELLTLCFELGVDYEELPASTKTGKARELIAHLDRHERIPDLIRIGKSQRPDVPWTESLLQAAWISCGLAETKPIESGKRCANGRGQSTCGPWR